MDLTREQLKLLDGFGIRPGMDEDAILERITEHRGEAGVCGPCRVEIGRRKARVDGRALSPAELKKAMEGR